MGASWWRAIMLQANIFIGFLSLNFESILAQNNIRDPCTNECQPGDPYSWCGERRYDSSGQVVRCVQGSRYGQECVDSCSAKKENYFWCWTNAHANGQSDYWEKCGTSKGDQSYTVKGVPCRSICEMKESTLSNNYWWCRDDDQDPDSWDYCSPSKHKTRYNEACREPCASRGESYFWCYTA